MRWRRSNFKRLFSVLPNGNIRCHLDDYKKTSVSEAQYINPKNIAPTLISGRAIKTIEQQINNDMAKIYRIRKLTPLECMRLMGVKDEDTQKMKDAGISDSQLYKMAGNSIVVPVLEGIFTQMFRVDKDCLF